MTYYNSTSFVKPIKLGTFTEQDIKFRTCMGGAGNSAYKLSWTTDADMPEIVEHLRLFYRDIQADYEFPTHRIGTGFSTEPVNDTDAIITITASNSFGQHTKRLIQNTAKWQDQVDAKWAEIGDIIDKEFGQLQQRDTTPN